jgi:hypothetical protein
MNSEKPQDIHEYKRWLKARHGIEVSQITQTYYESVTTRIEAELEQSEFWIQLTKNLTEYDGEYLVETGYPLLTPEFEPKLCVKPFDSFLLKTFRRNILENEHWPNEPEEGWLLPNNWYTKINDIVRTLLVVKYLDGVQFMIDKIRCLCEQHSMECTVFLEAREEGYYASHLYTRQEFEIPRADWDTEKIGVLIEIRITTQLQEVIRKLLHKFHEGRRKGIREEDIEKWQWDYKSDEFAANYLGYMLHYVEGMIMEIREKQKQG